MKKYIFGFFILGLTSISFLGARACEVTAVIQASTDVPLPNSLIKGSWQSVYYYASDGYRYVFPNDKTFKTWFSDFSSVKTVSNKELMNIPLKGNITYRPGIKMIKIQTSPKVYAVEKGGILRWIKTEELAKELYGANWNMQVDDVPDAFFTNYIEGEPIEGVSDYNAQIKAEEVKTINKDKAISETNSVLKSNTRVVFSSNSKNIQEEAQIKKSTPQISATVPIIGGCQMFPADNPWNTDISEYEVHPKSDTFIKWIGANQHLHADFGENQDYGIPYNIVTNQPKVPMSFTYDSESDHGSYPIPVDAKIEAPSDHHILVLETSECKLYEVWDARKNSDGKSWSAGSGAIFDLNSNELRPSSWTSADAAGLPILPGLVRYEEIEAGAINHAIRFTARPTQNGWIPPATHQAGYYNNDYPPMGLRVRLKADYDTSGFSHQAKTILEAMKKYGMILADNGGDWYFTGAPSPHWNDRQLNELKTVPGTAFEAVYTGEIVKKN